jgi:hypothetical protein
MKQADLGHKYRIIYDENNRKGVELIREAMYATAWYDRSLDQARWDPGIFGQVGNSVDSWAFDTDEIKFYIFAVNGMGRFILEKADLEEFYIKHPLHDELLYGKKRMVFPAKIWKKIEK